MSTASDVITAKRSLKEAIRLIAQGGFETPLFSLWLNLADESSTTLRLAGHDVAPLVDDWATDFAQEGLPFLGQALSVVR